MTRKLSVFSDLSEDAGGPHWLSPAGKRPQKRPNEKPKPKKKPKGIEQIRREHRTKHQLKQLRTRSTDRSIFMQQCVGVLDNSGGSALDSYQICELLWEDGAEIDDLY